MPEFPTFPFSDDGLRDALLALCPDVAGTLRKYGIRGKRLRESKCPVAEYLLRVLEGIEEVAVGRADVVAKRSVGSWSEVVKADLPMAAYDFVSDFDSDRYPDLEVSRAA